MEQPRFVVQHTPAGGSRQIFINTLEAKFPGGHQPENREPAPTELETQILSYCRAAQQLKAAGLEKEGVELELKAEF